MKQKSGSPRSRLWWSLLFVAIAALSVYAIVSQSRSFTLDTFADYIGRAHIPWVVCAVLCMVGFIVFEGEAVRAACRGFGHPVKPLGGFVYSASDIYFSAITPSATGGQPASAYFMIRDGVPPLVATVSLIANLAMYTLSIIVLGAVALLTQPSVFSAFGTLSRVLILAGFVLQAALVVFFVMLILHQTMLRKIALWGLHVLCRLHILRGEETRRERLCAHMHDYASYARMIREHPGAMVKTFLLNLLQRLCVISVPFFLSLASGGTFARSARVWAVQCCTVLGAGLIPIPGAMGVSDYMMLDGFSSFIPHADLVDFELLSRAISFYICVLLCGSVTLVKTLTLRKREN